MGRRKKEPPGFYRESIAHAAELLFINKGIVATTMDDIAKAAGYSKATLYVYYRSKEEIVSALTLKSMKLLHERMKTAISTGNNMPRRYYAVCAALVSYQEQFPFYFDIALGEINIDLDRSDSFPIDGEIYETGELIMAELTTLLQNGIAEKLLRADIQMPSTVFMFWAALSGIIVMAEKKQQYIRMNMGLTKPQFLDNSFETLLRSLILSSDPISNNTIA